MRKQGPLCNAFPTNLLYVQAGHLLCLTGQMERDSHSDITTQTTQTTSKDVYYRCASWYKLWWVISVTHGITEFAKAEAGAGIEWNMNFYFFAEFCRGTQEISPNCLVNVSAITQQFWFLHCIQAKIDHLKCLYITLLSVCRWPYWTVGKPH